MLFHIHCYRHVKLYSSNTTSNIYDDPSLLNVFVPNISNTFDATFDNEYEASISNDSDECLYNSSCDGLFYKYVGKRHAIYSPLSESKCKRNNKNMEKELSTKTEIKPLGRTLLVEVITMNNHLLLRTYYGTYNTLETYDHSACIRLFYSTSSREKN